MIVLDTNILSELVKPAPAPDVKKWLLHHIEGEILVTTAITVFEIEYGLARLPDGRRRNELEERFETLTGSHSEFEVLPFDATTARLAGKLKAAREASGFHVTSADMMIAAITSLAGAALATRNTKDFAETGIHLINPWGLMS